MTTNPIDLFREWHRHATATSPAAHNNAVCVSTVDESGMPHGRFVDLKSVRDDGFVFCTSYASPKGRQIEASAGVALTFWWDHVGRQVRVGGSAVRITDAEADAFFAERSRDAQVAAWAFQQSEELQGAETLASWAVAAGQRFAGGTVPRPPHWGGFLVRPRRMEFMVFDVGRAHDRVLFELGDSGWVTSRLQP